MAMKIIKENWLLIFVLIVVGFSVYAFNLNNPLFWDDTDWIVNNPFVHSFSWDNIRNWFTQNILAGINQSSNYYRPFLLFTFALNYFLGGENPVGYHLLSNTLHVSNAILIFLLFSYVFKNKFVSFWISLIWLVHPLQTEAVTYISGRGDPLNVFFMLLALWLITRQDLVKQVLPGKSKLVWFLPSILVILALLSRETAVIFPFLLMIFYISFISKERFLRSLKTAFIKALPYFGAVFVYGILRLTILNFENTLNFYSQSNIYAESFMVRMYTFLNVLWVYAGLMILPLWQHMERSVTIYTYFWNFPTVASSAVLLMVLGVLRYLYKKEILNSNFKVWFFGVAWFFVNLAMTSGITPINAQLYEHWLYLALLGPLTLVIFYLYGIFKVSGKTIKVFVVLLLVSVSTFFVVLSIKRNILWGDPVKFFENILKYEPDSARINNNLGYLYYDRGNKEKAEEYYWKATETTGNSFPQPYFNLGTILQEKGDLRGAVVVFEKAIELDPNFSYPYPNLAVIYASQGNLVKATEYLEKLKELQPRLQRVYYNLALVYIERKDYDSAHKNLEDGLKYGQFDPETEPLIKYLLKNFD
ncbi:MAG: tetratricopeptide repeat protein [bacterium]|nr:tetratricopeptide repeat protein [bacterium]